MRVDGLPDIETVYWEAQQHGQSVSTGNSLMDPLSARTNKSAICLDRDVPLPNGDLTTLGIEVASRFDSVDHHPLPVAFRNTVNE